MTHRSQRFQRNVWLTHHAHTAMAKRGVDAATVYDVIETGDILHGGADHYWIFKHIATRQDNLVCIAAVIGQAVIVKTVMVDWQKLQEQG